MSLTGPFFLDGIIALTVASFIFVIWIWPRFTRRTPWHVAGRVGVLALVNALVLLTAATQLNATYLFFSNWADVQGAMTGHIDQKALHRGGNARHAPNHSVAGHAARVVGRAPAVTQPVGSDGLLSYTVHGARSGLTGMVLVSLPPGYTPSSGQRYPVLEAFQGYPGSPLGWDKVYHLPTCVNQAVQAHEMRRPLIVMPQIEFPWGVDTEGVDGLSGQPQVDTWLTRDIPDWVSQHFAVSGNRNAWATIGLSAGGYVAAMATVLHPAQYGAGIVLGGYFRPEFGPHYAPFTATSPQGLHYDLTGRVADQPPPVSLWMETSHADLLSYASSMQFLHATRKPMAVHAVILQDAGHRASVWIAMEPPALRWLGKHVAGFGPLPGVAGLSPAGPRAGSHGSGLRAQRAAAPTVLSRPE
jgi:enterochelin esterase-like enzyme